MITPIQASVGASPSALTSMAAAGSIRRSPRSYCSLQYVVNWPIVTCDMWWCWSELLTCGDAEVNCCSMCTTYMSTICVNISQQCRRQQRWCLILTHVTHHNIQPCHPWTSQEEEYVDQALHRMNHSLTTWLNVNVERVDGTTGS